jgi:hypothetical protein
LDGAQAGGLSATTADGKRMTMELHRAQATDATATGSCHCTAFDHPV